MMQIFEEFNLKTTATANQKITNFLAITLNLSNGSYQPFKKPNDDTIHIHSHSNHPPSIIRQLPISISQIIRLNSQPTIPHFNMQHQLTTTLLNTVVSAPISNSSQTKHTHHQQQVIRETEQEISLGSTRRSVKTLKPTSARNFLTYSTIIFHLLIP